MASSKIALAPVGHAKWSYRHIEAIYAKCLVISGDISELNTLIPLPKNNVIQVPDHVEVLPVIKNALSSYKSYGRWMDQNIEILEKYLTLGVYDPEKRAILHRFEVQL